MIIEPVLNLLLFCKLWAEEENLPVFYTFYRIALATCRNPDKDRPLLAIAPLAWYSDVDGDSPIGKRKREKDERLSSFHFAVGFIIKSRGGLPKKCAEPLEKMAEEAFSVMAIEKNRFREWCLASGYQLPWFWFSCETSHLNHENKSPVDTAQKEPLPPDKTEASEILRSGQKRYCSQADKTQAIKAVYSAIQEKIKAGEYYHPRTEVRRYMEKKGICKDKETGLVNYIKDKCKDIHWPSGRASKF